MRSREEVEELDHDVRENKRLRLQLDNQKLCNEPKAFI